MNEIKNSLKWLAFYYLLLAVKTFLNIIPEKFPTDNISSIYLLILSICLAIRYYQRTSGSASTKKLMLSLSFMIFFFILLRCIKYSIFGNIFFLGRYTWYMYYVPMLLIPMLLFYISLEVFSAGESGVHTGIFTKKSISHRKVFCRKSEKHPGSSMNGSETSSKFLMNESISENELLEKKSVARGGKTENRPLSRPLSHLGWGWVAAVTVILIIAVLTNDLHQQIFSFQPDFAGWDSDYLHNWGFIIVTAWQYILYVVAVVILLVKCTVARVRHASWVILIPFAVGVTMMVLLSTGLMPRFSGGNIVEFPETLCFMAAGVVECCIQLGLIPANDSYKELMQIIQMPVQITDRTGNVVYKSESAKQLTEEQFGAPDNSYIGEHTILRRMNIPGGYGFWQIDVADLDKLNEELEEVRDRLSDETGLIRLQNELKEKQAKNEQKSLVYDSIARSTQEESSKISRLAELAISTEDGQQKENFCRRITLIAAYIKRYANLTLLSSERSMVSAGELGLSIAEVLRYLNLYGIPGELVNTAEGDISANVSLAVFKAFGMLLESCLPEVSPANAAGAATSATGSVITETPSEESGLSGVCATLSTQDGIFIFKLTLENIPAAKAGEVKEKINIPGARVTFEEEDNTGYFSLAIPGGGEGR